MSDQVFLDLVRLCHLAGLALGLGLALYADGRFLRLLATPIGRGRVAELKRIHTHVAIALGLLWLSGILLLAIRTGFDPAKVTPKLLTKLAVVTVMTVNARLIATVALPALERCADLAFFELPRRLRLRLALIGAVSAASWTSALLLGTFVGFRTMGAPGLALTVGGIFATALAAGSLLAMAAPVLRHAPRAPLRPLAPARVGLRA